jgi:RHS repeat-associated protein
VWQADYATNGEATLSSSNQITSNLRFPGQYFDAESNLHYNTRRYYDPRIGRYITQDPIGFSGGLNLYNYAGGNSVNYIDPTGEFIPLLVIAGEFAIGAGIDITMQLIENGGNWNCINWKSVGVSGVLGAVGGGVGGAAAQGIKIRKFYNSELKNALNQNLTHREAWQLRRDLGKVLKEQTPKPIRDRIYARNLKKYGDPLGPSFEQTMDRDPIPTVEKILTDTNKIVNLAMKIPEKPLPVAGATGGGSVGHALGGSEECSCNY